MKTKFEFKGDKAFLRRIEQMQKKSPDKAWKAIQNGTEKGVGYGKTVAPVAAINGGNLKASITKRQVRPCRLPGGIHAAHALLHHHPPA